MPYFSEAELRRVARAQRTFLSRPDFVSPPAYRRACNRAVKELLGADHAVFFEVSRDEVVLESEDTYPETLAFLAKTYRAKQVRDDSSWDDNLERFVDQRLRRGAGVYIDLNDRTLLENSPVYHKHFKPTGLGYLVGPSVPVPGGEVSICAAFETKNAALYGEQGLGLLELTLTAFTAGAQVHLHSAPAPLFSAAHFGLPLVAFDEAARETYRNPAFDDLVETPSGHELVACAADLAKAFLAARDRVVGRRQLTSTDGHYELTALPTVGTGFERGTLVLVTRRNLALPALAVIVERFKLTARQAEVAQLLAQGLTDRQVAEHLTISVNTARRHAEQVLIKLGVKTRAAVALALLG